MYIVCFLIFFTATAKFKPDTRSYSFYSKLKRELVVTIPFYSNPPAEISNIKWTNLSDNSIISQTENITFDLSYSPVSLTVHTVAVSLPGQIARMNISSFQSYHQGNYSVTISNGFPYTSSVYFWIIKSGKYNI